MSKYNKDKGKGMALRVLHVNLDIQQTRQQILPGFVEEKYLGGRGVAAWLLASRVDADTGPRSPANMLIFSTGPLSAAINMGSGGFMVTTRSSLTGLAAHSWAIGQWGAMLQKAGVDLLALEGQSAEWCYLQIDDDQISFHSAQALLGLDTQATVQALEQQLGKDYVVVCVGPAGEAGVAYSSIVAEGLYPAEPAGTGAVMAHKRVKAIALRGTATPGPANKTRVDQISATILKRIASSELATGIRHYGGSLYFADAALRAGAVSTRNGQESAMPHAINIDRNSIANRGKREARGCQGCPLPCASSYIRRNGTAMAYPELEAWAGFGGSCAVTTPDTIIMANDLCVRLGLDVSSTAAALAFMMECAQEGLARNTNLPWGDSEALLLAIKRLGERQEKRDVLSLGVAEMQDVYYGSSSFAPQVKGLAMPGLDPRALTDMALSYATSAIGGDYRYSMSYMALLDELPGWVPEAHASSYNPVARLIWHERFVAALDSAGFCRRLALMAYQVAPSEVTELIAATLGRPFGGVELARLGERVITFERMLARFYEPAEDTLPRRWLKTALDGGPAAGKLPDLEQQLAEYYKRHGWDQYGDPTPDRLAELEIDPL